MDQILQRKARDFSPRLYQLIPMIMTANNHEKIRLQASAVMGFQSGGVDGEVSPCIGCEALGPSGVFDVPELLNGFSNCSVPVVNLAFIIFSHSGVPSFWVFVSGIGRQAEEKRLFAFDAIPESM